MARAVRRFASVRLRRRGRLLLDAAALAASSFRRITPRSTEDERPAALAGAKAETIPAVGPDGGDVAMRQHEAYEFYGTSRGAVANYTNAFAVQSFAYTTSFDAGGRGPSSGAVPPHPLGAGPCPTAREEVLRRGRRTQVGALLQSQGQIDFYDDPRLIDPAVDAIAEHLTGTLA